MRLVENKLTQIQSGAVPGEDGPMVMTHEINTGSLKVGKTIGQVYTESPKNLVSFGEFKYSAGAVLFHGRDRGSHGKEKNFKNCDWFCCYRITCICDNNFCYELDCRPLGRLSRGCD